MKARRFSHATLMVLGVGLVMILSSGVAWSASNWWAECNTNHTEDDVVVCTADVIGGESASLVGSGPWWHCPDVKAQFSGSAGDIDCQQPCPMGMPDWYQDSSEDKFTCVWHIEHKTGPTSWEYVSSLGTDLALSNLKSLSELDPGETYRGKATDIDDTPGDLPGGDDTQSTTAPPTGQFTVQYVIPVYPRIDWVKFDEDPYFNAVLWYGFHWHASCDATDPPHDGCPADDHPASDDHWAHLHHCGTFREHMSWTSSNGTCNPMPFPQDGWAADQSPYDPWPNPYTEDFTTMTTGYDIDYQVPGNWNPIEANCTTDWLSAAQLYQYRLDNEDPWYTFMSHTVRRDVYDDGGTWTYKIQVAGEPAEEKVIY